MEHQDGEVSQEQEASTSSSGCIDERSSENGYSPVHTTDPPEHMDDINLEVAQNTSRLHSGLPPVNRREIFSGGWLTGCTYFAMLAAAVLLFNLIFTIYGRLLPQFDHENQLGKLFHGDCKKAKTLNLVGHLLINILGTALLSGSNYTMRCLSAPTRKEIDKAHSEKKWMDIGALSLRNLWRISRVRLVIWCVLGMSSVPLHFIYNSAILYTITNYEYNVWSIGEGNKDMNRTGFDVLTTKACLERYATQFVTNARDVVVVVPGGDPKDSLYTSDLNIGASAYNWICSLDLGNGNLASNCNAKKFLADTTSWAVNGTSILNCLSERMPEACILHYSHYIMIAVLVCNSMKLICILLTVRWGSEAKDDPLVVIGDAIVSFIDNPDKTTEMMCIMSKEDIKKGIWVYMGKESQRQWLPRKTRWFRAAGVWQWFFCYSLSVAGLAAVAALFAFGLMTGLPVNDSSFVWTIPLGTLDARLLDTIFSNYTKWELYDSIMLANLPQVIVSFLYLVYNSLFTCMLLAREWDQFPKYRSLRVSRPDDGGRPGDKTVGFYKKISARRPTETQGSTYFLQLPYRYSLPLIIALGFIHWTISQSIFVARIATLKSPDGSSSISENDIQTGICWSPVAIIIAITSLILLLVCAVICGLKKYDGDIPLVGSCSAAISAACHKDPSKITRVTGEVMWGEVWTNPDGVGHCSFTDEKVQPPEREKIYAGATSFKISQAGGDHEGASGTGVSTDTILGGNCMHKVNMRESRTGLGACRGADQ